MADVELVIKIPEEIYEHIKEVYEHSHTVEATYSYIYNGTPLPEGHGDILAKIRTEIEQLTYYWCEVNPKSVIDNVLEIIDKYKTKNNVEEITYEEAKNYLLHCIDEAKSKDWASGIKFALATIEKATESEARNADSD